MLNVLETLKQIIGVTDAQYDFIFILFSLFLILFLFSNLLGLLKNIFDFVGGRR